MGDWEDAKREIDGGTGGFYAPDKTIAVGQSEIITIKSYAKWTETKYPIKNKDGTTLGYTWRFILSDGRAWDVANRNRKVLLAGLHRTGDKPTPCRFKVTNTGVKSTKGPQCTVAIAEDAGAWPDDGVVKDSHVQL